MERPISAALPAAPGRTDGTPPSREGAPPSARNDRLAGDLAAMMRLHAISGRFGESSELPRLLDEVLDAVIEVTRADRGNIQLLDPATGTLTIVSQRGFDAAFLAFFDKVDAGHAACGEALRRQGRLVVDDVQTHPLFADPALRAVMLAAGTRAVQSTPLFSRSGRVLGMLSTHFEQPGRPSEHELWLVDLFAGQAAALVEHSQTGTARDELLARERAARREAERRAREAETLAGIARALTEETELAPLARRITESAMLLLDIDAASLRFLRPDGGLECIATGGRAAGIPVGDVIAPGLGVVGRAVATGHIAMTSDVLTDPAIPLSDFMRGQHRTLANRMVAVAPLIAAGQVIGTLAVGREETAALSHEEAALLQALADHAALAIRNTRLLARERSRLSEEQAASRIKDEFLATLSHELRNPVSAILNAAGVLARVHASDTQRSGALAAIRRQARQIGRLLEDLLDLDRIGRSRLELRTEPVDLRAVVDAAVEAHRHAVDAKRQTLRIALPGRTMTVVGDAARLQQIVGNLLSNATRYTPMGGSIALGLAEEAGRAVLRVRDDGVGIPPERLETIFDLFVQVGPRQVRAEAGLGIGLTLVKRLVELHGGRVCARSDGPGHGAEFVVDLPLTTAGRTAVASEPPTPIGRRRIVVIEDNDDAREVLVTLLRLDGHEVEAAATGLAGIELASARSPDVVLVDVGLPDLDGFEVCRRLRRTHGYHGRLIAVTGYGQTRDRERSAAAGFDAHLVKPVDAADLAAALARLDATDLSGRRPPA